MSPEFRNNLGGKFGDGAEDEDRSPVDFNRFRFTSVGRRKLRGKKKPVPAGLHKRHNKRVNW